MNNYFRYLGGLGASNFVVASESKRMRRMKTTAIIKQNRHCLLFPLLVSFFNIKYMIRISLTFIDFSGSYEETGTGK